MVCFVKLANCMVLNMNYCSSFCTSNLSAFDSSSDLHNFGPNITVIFIPGALNCSIPVLIYLIAQPDDLSDIDIWISMSIIYYIF